MRFLFMVIISLFSSIICYSAENKIPRDGRKYFNNSTAQRQTTQPYIAALELKGNERVLDLGCGNGRITAEIAQRIPFGRIVGLDSSENMIEFAKRQFSNIPNISFIVGDEANIDLGQQFDLIVSFNTLHWVKNQKAPLELMRKHLAPQGSIYLLFANKWEHIPFYEAIGITISKEKWAAEYFDNFNHGFNQHSIDQYYEDLSLIGFDIQKLSLYPKIATFKDKESVNDWLKGWMPHLNAVPEVKREDFANDFVDEFTALAPTNDTGEIVYDKYFLEVKAKL